MCRVSQAKFLLDKYIAGLCFNRTGKQGAKASETGHDRERNTHPQRLSSPSPGRYLPGLFPHRTQTPQRSFQGTAAGTHATPSPNRAHSGSHGETRGVLDGGGITTLGAFCAVRKPCGAGCQNDVLCRFWVLVGCVPEERGEPAGQRCAHACRCSAGVAAPLGCVIPLLFLSPH